MASDVAGVAVLPDKKRHLGRAAPLPEDRLSSPGNLVALMRRALSRVSKCAAARRPGSSSK